MKLEPLEPELRQLLDAARRRDAEDPADDPDARPLLARVEAAVRETSAGRAPTATRASSRWFYSFGAIVSVISIATVGTFVVRRSAPEEPTQSGALAISTHATSAAPPITAPAETSDDRSVPTLRIDDLPSAAKPDAPRPSASTAVPVATVEPNTPSGPTLAEEIRLVERARNALGAKDLETALRAAREHEKQYPAGQLAQERERIYIQALAEAGHTDEARARRDAFRTRFPNGLLRPSVERAAADAGSP